MGRGSQSVDACDEDVAGLCVSGVLRPRGKSKVGAPTDGKECHNVCIVLSNLFCQLLRAEAKTFVKTGLQQGFL